MTTPIYVYPKRTEEYQSFVTTYLVATRQAIMLKLLIEGFAVVQEEWQGWRFDPQPLTALIMEKYSSQPLEGPYRISLEQTKPPVCHAPGKSYLAAKP